MDRSNYQASNCSIARTLGVVGEKWTLLILRESFYGSTRFEEFHEILKCPRNLLSDRLAKLVEEGVLERSEYREPGRRARFEYRMTEVGLELTPILLALREWGDRHRADPAGPPAVTQHAGCGKDVHVELRCTAGHRITGPQDMELAAGPGLLPLAPA